MDESSVAETVETVVERLDTLERVLADFFVELSQSIDVPINVSVAAGKQLNRLLGVD